MAVSAMPLVFAGPAKPKLLADCLPIYMATWFYLRVHRFTYAYSGIAA